MNVWYCLACGVGLEPKNHYCDSCCEKLHKEAEEYEKREAARIAGKTIIEVHGIRTTVAELDEVRRRAPINVKKDGTYDLGRLGENGKIQDREPSYGDWG